MISYNWKQQCYPRRIESNCHSIEKHPLKVLIIENRSDSWLLRSWERNAHIYLPTCTVIVPCQRYIGYPALTSYCVLHIVRLEEVWLMVWQSDTPYTHHTDPPGSNIHMSCQVQVMSTHCQHSMTLSHTLTHTHTYITPMYTCTHTHAYLVALM